LKNLILIIFTILPSLCFAQQNDKSQSDWNFVTEKNNIKVYTRSSDQSNIKELRILVELTGNIDTLFNLINNSHVYSDWVYKCKTSAPLATPEGYTFAYVLVTDFPFPMYDRELIVKSKQWVDEQGRYRTHSVSEPAALPKNNKMVRIDLYESNWTIEKIGEKIFIEYQSTVDPGGNIPAWVVNLGLTTGPIKTFTKLIELTEGRSSIAEFSVIR